MISENNKTALFIAGNVRSLVANRKDLIISFKKEGFKVVALVPENDFNNTIDELGIEYIKMPLSRQTVNPLQDYKVMKFITHTVKNIKPDIVFSYTIKPVIYGSLAAKEAGIKTIYSMITGLGYVYTGQTLKQKLLKLITNELYKKAFRANKKVFFQNIDDARELIDNNVLNEEKSIIVNGSGINLDQYPYTELKESKTFNVLMVARLIKDKGIFEYISAAEKVKEHGKNSNILFHLMGSLDNNPNALTKTELNALIEKGIVIYHPFEKDVRNKISEAHLVVLPSYREGTPRVILEAMSMGRAIITTNAPGCRETVVEGENGFLVPVNDYKELVDRILFLSKNNEILRRMGSKSREIAESKYDVKKVNKAIMSEMLKGL